MLKRGNRLLEMLNMRLLGLEILFLNEFEMDSMRKWINLLSTDASMEQDHKNGKKTVVI